MNLLMTPGQADPSSQDVKHYMTDSSGLGNFYTAKRINLSSGSASSPVDSNSNTNRGSTIKYAVIDSPTLDHTRGMSFQKEALKDEVDEEERTRGCCASCRTILTYLVSEQTKKARGFKIGIFTVFLVVMIITMLKSVVDSAPILFVKVGQDSVGAIDFTLSAPTELNAMSDANTNWYADEDT